MTTCVVNCRVSPYDVYIGRPSKWGNPWEVGRDGTRAEVIAAYEAWVRQNPTLLMALDELVGKRLGCWCPPAPCHGEVLVRLVRELGLEG